MVYAISPNYGYYNLGNNLIKRPKIAFQGEKSSLSDKKENDKKNSDIAAKLLLWGGVLTAISATAFYFLTRGRAGGEKVASDMATNVLPDVSKSVKLNPETKFVEKLEKSLPKFQEGQELVLKNGGKRFDVYEDGYNVSRYYDKNGNLNKQVFYDEATGKFCSLERYAKSGEVKSSIELSTTSDLMHRKFDEKGRVKKIICGNNEQNFNYTDYSNGYSRVYQGFCKGENGQKKLYKYINSSYNERGELNYRYSCDRVAKTIQEEWYNKGEYLYISKLCDIADAPRGIAKSQITHKVLNSSDGKPIEVLIEETGKPSRVVKYADYLFEVGV